MKKIVVKKILFLLLAGSLFLSGCEMRHSQRYYERKIKENDVELNSSLSIVEDSESENDLEDVSVASTTSDDSLNGTLETDAPKHEIVDDINIVETREDYSRNHFDCLPQMKQATINDKKIQVDDILYDFSVSMTFADVIDQLENKSKSGCYTNFDLNQQVAAYGFSELCLYKNNELYISITGQNKSKESVSMGDCVIIMIYITLENMADIDSPVDYKLYPALANTFYPYGLRADGFGCNYKGLIKLFTENEIEYFEREYENEVIVETVDRKNSKALANAYDGLFLFCTFSKESGECKYIYYGYKPTL